MGRKRNNSIGIWLSDKELESLKVRISKTPLSQSAFIRKCLLERQMTVIPGIRDLTIEIKRIGNNINQMRYCQMLWMRDFTYPPESHYAATSSTNSPSTNFLFSRTSSIN